MEPFTIKRALFFGIASLVLIGCQQHPKPLMALNENETIPVKTKAEKRQLSEKFKTYWFNGEAEISSYTLEQARYGELRDGHAVLVYVTEPFLKDIQVKADRAKPGDINVLKLNYTKKFNTGIYPYSIMTSTFQPTKQKGHPLKVSSSMQEWCGHVYSQLNNREQYEIKSHSYFEGEADKDFNVPKQWLEDELWTLIRLAPEELPTGKLQLIPSFEAMRLRHLKTKGYTATLKKIKTDSGFIAYHIDYPELKRSLIINYQEAFPHKIMSWEERFISGFGKNAKPLSTKATLKKTLLSPYWSKNKNVDLVLRKQLQIE